METKPRYSPAWLVANAKVSRVLERNILANLMLGEFLEALSSINSNVKRFERGDKI